MLKSSAVERDNTGGPTASSTMNGMTQVATVGLASAPATMASTVAHLTTTAHRLGVIGKMTIARHLLACDGTIHQTVRKGVVVATAITNALIHKVARHLRTRNRAT